jgi:hypothetical protein
MKEMRLLSRHLLVVAEVSPILWNKLSLFYIDIDARPTIWTCLSLKRR